MYWCKLKVTPAIFVALGLLCLAACKPDVKQTGAALTFFDIQGYFQKDTSVLQKKKPPVLKTVTHNGQTQSKTVHIADWGKELNLFFAADINRPAWKDSYTVVDNSDFLIYKAKDPELQTRQVIIKKGKDKTNVAWLLIYTRTKNFLYQTTAKLTYYPDSLYIIEQQQHVRLMGNNTYMIKGVLR